MINVKEIRIDNWVERLDGSQFQITASDIELISSINQRLAPKPIQLTNKVLKACGFYACNDYYNTYRLDSTEFSGYLFEIELKEPFYFKICGLLVNHFRKIEYLHQLQNLHLDITGREIDYKPLNLTK